MMKPDNGIINLVIDKLGGDKIYFFGEAKWGPSIYVLTGIWQESGWNAVIYLAALSSLDPKIMEAATIDGANRFQKIRYIELPTILPVISIMLIMSLGSIMNVGTGKMLLIRNSLNTSTTQVIGTYVYDISIANGQYEFGTAVSMFNTIINFSLLITVNWISGKLNGTTLF